MNGRWHYFDGAERYKRWNGSGDVRGHRSARGWTATADLIDVHPINGKPLRCSEWWIFERREHHRF